MTCSDTMTSSYDPDKIMAEADQWRQKAAAAIDPAYRDECLRRAARCEDLVNRSLRTLSIKGEKQRTLSIKGEKQPDFLK